MVIASKYVRFTLNIIKKKLTIQLINNLNKIKLFLIIKRKFPQKINVKR